jgi:hypothetical protein
LYVNEGGIEVIFLRITLKPFGELMEFKEIQEGRVDNIIFEESFNSLEIITLQVVTVEVNV